MKKQLTRGFAAILAFCLIAALNLSLPLEASFETGEAWDDVEMFSADTPEPEPWGYYASLDGGETFSLMSVYAEEEWGNYWYSAEKEIGLGTNHDAEGYLEANVADANSAVAALGFTAPETGNYLIEASGVPNLWNQDGDEFLIRTADTAYFIINMIYFKQN